MLGGQLSGVEWLITWFPMEQMWRVETGYTADTQRWDFEL